MEHLPSRGIYMILLTVLMSVFLMIYIGADFSKNRIENRQVSAGNESVWWEKGFVLVCPLH